MGVSPGTEDRGSVYVKRAGQSQSPSQNLRVSESVVTKPHPSRDTSETAAELKNVSVVHIAVVTQSNWTH